MIGNNLESIIAKTQPIISQDGLCQLCKVSAGGYNYVSVETNRKINACFDCRLEAMDWLQKECLVCKDWLFGQQEAFKETCSISCEKKYQESLDQERIIYGKFANRKKI